MNHLRLIALYQVLIKTAEELNQNNQTLSIIRVGVPLCNGEYMIFIELDIKSAHVAPYIIHKSKGLPQNFYIENAAKDSAAFFKKLGVTYAASIPANKEDAPTIFKSIENDLLVTTQLANQYWMTMIQNGITQPGMVNLPLTELQTGTNWVQVRGQGEIISSFGYNLYPNFVLQPVPNTNPPQTTWGVIINSVPNITVGRACKSNWLFRTGIK